MWLGGKIMSKDFLRDILMCILIIVAIKIAELYFPNNIFVDIVVIGIGVYYFGGKVIRFIKKRKLENNN